MQMGGKRAYLGVLLLEARRMAMEAGGWAGGAPATTLLSFCLFFFSCCCSFSVTLSVFFFWFSSSLLFLLSVYFSPLVLLWFSQCFFLLAFFRFRVCVWVFLWVCIWLVGSTTCGEGKLKFPFCWGTVTSLSVFSMFCLCCVLPGPVSGAVASEDGDLELLLKTKWRTCCRNKNFLELVR